MAATTLWVGSLEILGPSLEELPQPLGATSDVVLVMTAAAFGSSAAAAVALAGVFEEAGARVEALMVSDRAAASESYFADRVTRADLVVLADGSPLHARSVWRQSALGEAIEHATQLIALGAVTTVLGEVMIDPRGGAPMTGLGYRPGVVVASAVAESQLARTRELLGPDLTFAVLGPRGVLVQDEDGWRVRGDDVVVTRGHDVTTI